jgi:cellulose synthase/poly-beta-1,6-N-acetylglucosamine synthase-like glycosyltransferase/peptidoglycan/xylan/chitin deacetylase (PgdA/CDA1 family)
VLLAVAVLALLAGLLLQGYAVHEVGRSGTAPASADAAQVEGGGAVLHRQGAGLTSRSLPPRTVALTFDDGPDPRWTPRVLDVLAREHVPATFFLVGTHVADSPDLVRRELRQGDEVGSHSFTHADLSVLPAWRRDLELSLTQLALAGATGRHSALLRPPYSSTPDALTAPALSSVTTAADDGYVVVLSDRDSEDWRRPGASAVVRNALPEGDAGALVLFHDAGGDRSQTLAALPQVIAELKARGYRFTTVSQGLGLAPLAGVQPVHGLTRAQGVGFLLALRLSSALARLLQWLLLPLGLLAVLRTLVLVALARRHVREYGARGAAAEEFLPPVSVIVPAYNEAVGIAAAVRSLASSDYPELEVVVVDDGSTDATCDVVEGLALPNVRLARQANAGKAAALNTGVAHARFDVVVMVDGDTVFEPDTVRRLVQQLRDPRVGAVSGNTKVGNRRGVLGRWQHLEYVSGFNLDRRMYDVLRCMPTVPGAIGAFRRSVLEEIGGVSTDTLAEDTDLTMAINRAGYGVVYEESARAWTEAPASLSALWRQRYRWCYGTLQAVWKHRGAVRSSGPGWQLGRIGLPYLLFFQVLLPLLAPVIDVYALYGLVFLDARLVLAYWCGFLLLQLLATGYALHLDRESLRPLWTLPLQQFVYRQVMYLVVVQSVVSALSGVRLRWHKLERTGELDAVAAARA